MEDTPCLWIRKPNIVKTMENHLQIQYILYQNPNGFSSEIENPILKFYMESQGNPNSWSHLEKKKKKTKLEDSHLLITKLTIKLQ